MSYLPMILEKFIEAIVGLVVNFFPSLISNLPTEASARAELVKLSDRANQIRAPLADAEQNRQIENESVLLWLSELRSIAFDAEDLEEFETRARVATRASHWVVLSSAWYYWCVLSRVDEINKKYDVIYQDRQATMLQECGQARVVSTTRRSGAHQTGSLEGIRRLHGRHDESERLIRLLREPMNSGRFPPVISIIGAGGMGKTALAQSAFNYPDIFNCPDITNRIEPIKIWVSLSPNLGLVKIIKMIIEAISKTNCNLSTLDMLQHRLRQLLSGKLFLLVLNGVYTEDPLSWDTVWTPLNTAHPRSKILVTTRNRSTAQYMGSTNFIDVDSLNSTFLWLVLKDEAFPNASPSDSVPGNLRNIAKKLLPNVMGPH